MLNNFGHLVVALLVLIVTVAYAYLVACYTEFKTAGARRWVESWLSVVGLSKRASAVIS